MNLGCGTLGLAILPPVYMNPKLALPALVLGILTDLGTLGNLKTPTGTTPDILTTTTTSPTQVATTPVLTLNRIAHLPMPVPPTLGPHATPVEQRAGRIPTQLLMRCAQRAPLDQALYLILGRARKLPEGRQCRWHLDVDPVDML